MEEHKETQATSHQKTVLLVNTFVINTARLLNKFAKQCELKLDKVHRRIREVEYTVTMLEQRLSAFDGPAADPVPPPAPTEAPPAPPLAQISTEEAPTERSQPGYVATLTSRATPCVALIACC